jgi:hypothetical protein
MAAETYEALVTQARVELGRPATGAELATRSHMSLEDFLQGLAESSNTVADEFRSFGLAAVKSVSRIIPELDEPEAEILRMYGLHDMSKRKISRALELRDTTVAGWTTLSLLRTLPLIRAEQVGARAARRPSTTRPPTVKTPNPGRR